MSNLAYFKSAVKTAWEALTPASDGSSAAYRFVDDFVEERGNGQHRALLWRAPRRGRLMGEHAEQVEWTQPCELYLWRTPPGQDDRTYDAFAAAVAAEATDLLQTFSRLSASAFNAAVLEPILDDMTIVEREPVRPPGTGGVPRARVAVVTFNFRVLVQE